MEFYKKAKPAQKDAYFSQTYNHNLLSVWKQHDRKLSENQNTPKIQSYFVGTTKQSASLGCTAPIDHSIKVAQFKYIDTVEGPLRIKAVTRKKSHTGRQYLTIEYIYSDGLTNVFFWPWRQPMELNLSVRFQTQHCRNCSRSVLWHFYYHIKNSDCPSLQVILHARSLSVKLSTHCWL